MNLRLIILSLTLTSFSCSVEAVTTSIETLISSTSKIHARLQSPGYNIVALNLTFVNPCQMASITVKGEWGSFSNRELCLYLYQKMLIDEMENMCPQEKIPEVHRPKRFIPLLLAPIILSLWGVGAAAAKGGQRKTESRPNTSHLLDESSLGAMEEEITKLRGDFNKAVEDMSEFESKHNLPGQLIDEVSSVNHIFRRLDAARAIIQDANKLWKQGKVSEALLMFFNIDLPLEVFSRLEEAAPLHCHISEDRNNASLHFKIPSDKKSK